jgi:hypothetical protein
MQLGKLGKRLATTLLLTSLIWVSGCDNFVADSAGVWAKIEISAPPTLSPDGLKAFNEVSAKYPEDAKKIIGRNNELLAAIKAYNEKARKHNRELYEKIHMSKAQIDTLEP